MTVAAQPRGGCDMTTTSDHQHPEDDETIRKLARVEGRFYEDEEQEELDGIVACPRCQFIYLTAVSAEFERAPIDEMIGIIERAREALKQSARDVLWVYRRLEHHLAPWDRAEEVRILADAHNTLIETEGQPPKAPLSPGAK